MTTLLSSRRNARVRELLNLRKRRVRDETRRTVVEGDREAWRALQQGVVPAAAYLCPELLETPEAQAAAHRLRRLAQAGESELFELSPDLFAHAAYRGESGGILLVVPYLNTELGERPPLANPFMLVIEGAEKPGNVGAVLRTADAAGLDLMLLCPGPHGRGTDIHNPNTIRASLGAVFTVPVATPAGAAARAWLRARDVAIVAATPEAGTPYTQVDLTGPVALVAGSEARGLSPDWLEAADRRVCIPMRGQVDSLNLATSAALLMYEVVRQRQEAPAV